jgi:hypothetical protein
VPKEERGEDAELLAIVLEHQLSYFRDLESIIGFLECLHKGKRETAWIEVFQMLVSGLNAESPREPFSLRQLKKSLKRTPGILF